MKPRVSPFLRTAIAALCPLSAFAANNTFTLGGAISTATNWSAATWTPSNPGAGAAGDIILRSADSNANSLNLDLNFTTGSIRFTSANARTFQINATGSNAITFDGTGISIANNSFSNANTASIVAASAGGTMNIRPHIILTNSNLDVGIGSGASNTPTINIGDTTANATSITNADSTDRNLNFRINIAGNVNVSSTIGAAGSTAGGATGTGKINISNLGTSNGTVTISGNLTSGVGSVTQNSANSRLSLSGANTYAGNYTITNGALAFITRTALYNADTSQWTASKINVSSGGILGLGYGDSSKFSATEIQSFNTGNILVAGSSLGIDVSDTRVYSNIITNANGGATSIGFAKLGAGTLGLNAANTYTGTTTLFQGNLRLDAAQGVSSGPLGANSGSIYFNGGTLQYSAANTHDYSNRFSTAANQNIRIDTNGQNVTFASVISGSTNQITKSGTGILTLTAENTYGAAGNVFTTISGGTVRGADPTAYVGNANLRKVFGTGAIQPGNGTTLELRANGQNDSSTQTLTYGNQIQVSATGATYNINVDQESATGGTNKIIAMGTHNVGANTTMNLTGGNGFSLQIGNYAPGGGGTTSTTLLNPVGANLLIGSIGGGSNTVSPTVGLGGTSTGNTVTGIIANNSTAGATGTAILKSNTGTWSLNGANTYTGATTVNGGTLYINNSTAVDSREITVNSGGTLGGTGHLFSGGTGTSLSAGVTVSGGTVNPGSLNSSVGLLRVASISTTGALNFAAGGTYFWDLAAFADNSGGVAGTDFDQIELTGSGGNLVLGGTSALTLAFGNAITSPDSADPFWQAARSWTIVKGGASTTNTGSTNFAQITNGTYASGSFTTTSDALGNVILNFTPIPEPSTTLIAALGGLAILRRRRR